ncbi:MAG: type II toxin-antitoxin system RelE/ParE family toxin [Planctomycetota bacterium]
MARQVNYRLEFKPSAAKALKRLPRDLQERIAPRVSALAHNPLPDDVKLLKGKDKLYRIRVGDIRIVYTIIKDRVTILVLAIAKREDIYRELRRLNP